MQYRPIILLLVLISNIVAAQDDWVVPEDKKSKLSNFEFTDEVRASGEDIFSTNCALCHGQPGKNNFVPLVPPPGDPASTKFQANTDGEFFYRINEGRGAMPSFKNILTNDQVWSVISYIRSFNSSYVQEVSKEIKRGAYEGEVSIQLAYKADKKLIEAKVIGTKDNESEALEGVEIKLFVERYFGNLTIDEDKLTNKDGIALFAIEKEIPGDAEGNLKLMAQLSDQEAFGLVTTESVIKVGTPTHAPSLVANRAMWNKMNKAPIWVLLSYSIAVLATWGTIFYILFQIKRIFMIGKETEI
jgi:cytochrome c5